MGTVPLDSVEESEVRKLAFDRLRSSLKKGMAGDEGLRLLYHKSVMEYCTRCCAG